MVALSASFAGNPGCTSGLSGHFELGFQKTGEIAHTKRRCLMKSPTLPSNRPTEWIADYRETNAQLISADPAFAAWLETEYIPIAGGWQY